MATQRRSKRRASTAQAVLAALPLDPTESAKAAGLRYVSDALPGISRLKHGSRFRYVDQGGHGIRDKATLARIKKLAIPPAYTDVWISPFANGHLQATGRDARRRKQYRYHARWREVRDETKYGRMVAFADALPRIRKRVEEDLAKPGLPREKVLATVVRLLETTLIRIGNQEYAKENGSFGLTTLRTRHVDVDGTELRFRFRGKSGKEHTVGVRDRRLANVVRRLRDLPGQELFQYVADDGSVQNIDSGDVNEYLRESGGEQFTAKDFRTWVGTLACALELRRYEVPQTPAEAKRNIVEAVKTVAQRLGNTPAICRKSYVHPLIVEAYEEGTLSGWLPAASAERKADDRGAALDEDEKAVVRLLQRRLEEAA